MRSVCWMARWRLTAHKNMVVPPQSPVIHISNSSTESDTESDSVPCGGKSDRDRIDYVPAGPETEIPILEDSEGDDVQILEPLPIPVTDLISEVEVLGSPPISDEDLEDKDEKELELMDTSEDTVGEQEELVELDELVLSFEKSRKTARDRNKWINYWRMIRKTAKRTCI
jgi:hypothetical protein